MYENELRNEIKTNNIQAGLVTKQNGEVCQTLKNCFLAMSLDENLRDMFRYNLMTDKIEITKAWWPRYTIDLSDIDENNIRLYLETKYGLTSEKGIPRAIELVAHQNPYHPVQERLESLTWDGVPRVNRLLTKYLGCAETEYTKTAIRIFMLAAISRVFEPGTKFDTMIVLVEDKQGGGKSTLSRFLAIEDSWFTDDIKNLEDESTFEKLRGHWVIELSEMLATANTKTTEAIKSFLSRQKDTFRIPYSRYARDFPRQCVLLGTTNNLDFLPNDRTGNRRFVPIQVNSASAEIHPMQDEAETREYILQCWAEMMEVYKTGEFSLVFPEHLQEELQKTREKYMPESPEVGVIQNWLDNCNYDSVCSLMIYRECLGNEFATPKRWELSEINSIMNKSITGWQKYPTATSQMRFQKYGVQRAWVRLSTKNEKFVDEDGFMFDDNNEIFT